ncbi:MAG: hypothetical protein AB1736_11725 [Chloroflexota bacterium]
MGGFVGRLELQRPICEGGGDLGPATAAGVGRCAGEGGLDASAELLAKGREPLFVRILGQELVAAEGGQMGVRLAGRVVREQGPLGGGSGRPELVDIHVEADRIREPQHLRLGGEQLRPVADRCERAPDKVDRLPQVRSTSLGFGLRPELFRSRLSPHPVIGHREQ